MDASIDDLKNRVRRRLLRGSGPLPEDERILRVRERRDGRELLLRDEDDDLLAALAAVGDLGEGSALDLEELFLAVMGGGALIEANEGEGDPVVLKLIRRDLDWAFAFSLISTLLVVTVVFDASRAGLFVFPDTGIAEPICFLLYLIGAVLGLFVGLRDRLTRTEDWLHHRPVSRRTLALRQHLTCLAALSIWYLLPLLLRRLVALDRDRIWMDEVAVAIDDTWSCWATLLAITTMAWTGYAITFFATRAPGGYFSKLLTAVALIAAWLFASASFLGEHWRLEAWSFVLVQALCAGSLLTLAHWNDREASDLDRPTSARTMRLNALALGLALALGSGVLATEMQWAAVGELVNLWPSACAW